jgi:cytochrome c5
MKWIINAALIAAVGVLLALPTAPRASELDGVTEKEVSSAEGTPPEAPHSLTKGGELRDCLACHEKGINGAPQTPHPERVTCTQCHGQGEIRVDLDIPDKGKKKK